MGMYILLTSSLAQWSSSSSTTFLLSAATCQCPLNAPIEDVVILVAFANKKVTEELAQVRIVRFVVESECTSVVEARDSRSSQRACSTPRWVLIEV
jgi:hypothetical protein